MVRWLILALLLCTHFAFAEGLRPKPPEGWLELTQADPILLSWTKPKLEKRLAKAPNITIQKFKRSEKFEKFVKEKPLDKDNCRDLKDEGWNQTWCLKNTLIFALLSKNEDAETNDIRETLKTWVLTHD